LKIKKGPRLFNNLAGPKNGAQKTTQNLFLKGNTMPSPQPAAATSFATKAVYLLFGAVVLVFVAMLALTVLHP
jgi:hypothetical protein